MKQLRKDMVINTIKDLEKYIKFNEDEKDRLLSVEKEHPFAITPYYLGLISKQDMSDPIYRMSIPSVLEEDEEGVFDTSGELDNIKIPGLQHKYPETALVLTTNACKMYCRHCFRKRLVGVAEDEIAKDWDKIVEYIQEHTEITNVLLSGGDSFVLETEKIIDILERLSAVKHLKFIRLGTRIPVVYPQRIIEDQKLLDYFKDYNANKKKLYVTTQFNHSVEITTESMDAVELLKESGLTVNNQTVLLKGVNDDAAVLAELLKNLTKIGVIPYYVFQCRPVARVKTIFQVSIKEGAKIIEDARKQLDGYAKRFRYVMSHKIGKIEIIGAKDDQVYFKYHEAKDPSNHDKIFIKELKSEGWLDDL